MVETENGVWMLVKATVDKAGTPDKPDKDDDEPETQEPPEQEKGYTVSEDGKTYEVYNADGLMAWNKAVQGNLSLNCTLTSNIDLTGTNWTPIGTGSDNAYTGTFDGGGHKILNLKVNASGQCGGLFGYIEGATVKHLTLDAPAVSTTFGGNTAWFGGIAGYMGDGTIDDCHVTGGSISCTGDNSAAGGIVGYVHIYNLQTDENVVKNCQVSGVTISAQNAGGVAGNTDGKNSRIENCKVSGCTITANVSDGYTSFAGGIAGSNSSTVKNCLAQSNTINADAKSNGGRAGGVVGWTANPEGLTVSCGSVGNNIQATYAAGGVVGYMNAGGSVTACFSANDIIMGDSYTGGVVGYSAKGCAATKCYWFGTTTDGVGDGSGTNDTHQVGTGEITWSTVAAAMNEAGGNQWQYKDSDSCPTLNKQ